MATSLAGQLLVASPQLEDPHFLRTVILVLDHDEEGALGLVLNRASEVRVADAVAAWGDLAADPAVVFGGGPVEPSAGVALGRTTARVGPDGGALLDDVRLVDLSADPALEAVAIDAVRVFAGYAGWAPGQLEQEVEQGAWFPLPALEGDVFTTDPPGLWHAVLRRLRGDLRLLATFPADPSLN
jgi:putative transcriptional regulator